MEVTLNDDLQLILVHDNGWDLVIQFALVGPKHINVRALRQELEKTRPPKPIANQRTDTPEARKDWKLATQQWYDEFIERLQALDFVKFNELEYISDAWHIERSD